MLQRMDYQQRVVDEELDELLDELPAISLEGARGVGKTATAERRARTAHYLDDPSQRAVASADPKLILNAEPPVLIDEWQREPAVWDAVRRAVDRGCDAGQFLLTGSAGPRVAPSHSGAGRIVTLRMRPMTLLERGMGEPRVRLRRLLSGRKEPISGRVDVALSDYVDEIVRSGYPGIRELTGRALKRQLDGYLRRIIDTDFEEQGYPVRKPIALTRWLQAYAAATATSASFEKIRDAATGGVADKPAKTTTLPYRDVLSSLWILDPLPAWIPSGNQLNRLAQSPKHHLADPALAVRALGMDTDALLAGPSPTTVVPQDGTLLGHLFESLVTLCVRVYAQQAEATMGHLRMYGGRREVDLIVERADRRVVAIEVKLGNAVEDHDVANLVWLRERLGESLLDAAVIHTGPRAYRRDDGIAVVPAALLGP